MCGICGILCCDSPGDAHEERLVERMTDALVHRGPDDHGTWRNGRILLGHRRLSIIDLSPAGRQPMANEDGTIQIVYNGEVYNFRELKERHQLVERGHRFRSRTDTEVLIHLYEELGIQMVRELNGMFAFALWDGRRQELHLARDRYGIKPLFYTWQGDRFLFASEIKAILRDHRVPRRVNVQALHDFLSFDYIPGEQTAFEGIREVPAAHWMTLDSQGHTTSECYWDLSFEINESADERSVVHHAHQCMDRAVERRLISDVPVGVLLSGGMDSSTLVALIRQRRNEPIHTYAVGFEDRTFNELPYARLVAERFQTIHKEVVVTAQRVRDVLPGYLSFIDEPYGDGSAIPTYYVCQLAKKEVGVVLSGEGGDEAFAGYETYAAHVHARRCAQIPLWVRRYLIEPLVNKLPVSHKKLSFEFKLKRFLKGLDLPPAQAHLWWRLVLSEAQKREIYHPDVLEQFVPEPAERHFLDAFNRMPETDILNRLMYIDSRVFLPDDLMIKNDRMSMAHSLEARVPLTDHELTQFMAMVPMGVKFPRLRKKHVMRQAMRDVLPRAILNKKKVGLEIPYSRWLKHELKDVLMEYCGPEKIGACGLFRPEGVKQLIDQHLENHIDHGRALWGLMNYMMWHDHYIACSP